MCTETIFPSFSWFPPFIPNITWWNPWIPVPSALYSFVLLLRFSVFLPRTCRFLSTLPPLPNPSPTAFVFHTSHPPLNLSPSLAPRKCHILRRQGSINLKRRLKQQRGKIAPTAPLRLYTLANSLTMSPCYCCTSANIFFINQVVNFLSKMCSAGSLFPVSRPNNNSVSLLLIDPQKPCFIYDSWAAGATAKDWLLELLLFPSHHLNWMWVSQNTKYTDTCLECLH